MNKLMGSVKEGQRRNPVLLGVMSDSHDNLPSIEGALEVFRRKHVDVIVHLGDIISPFALVKVLEFPAKILIILGNNDGDHLQLKEIATKAGAVLREGIHATTIANRKVLMMHGAGTSETTELVINALASSNTFDVVLYGHTHKASAKYIGNTLVLNPGETCGYLTGTRSVAILDLERMAYEIVSF